jgi:hypothetical protein
MKTHTEYLGNGIINIHVSFAVKRRNGRKLIITPDGGQPLFESKPVRDNTMIKVLVRAFKWRKLYESGTCPSFDALSERLKINKSYIAKVLQANLLAPDIKEAILNGTQPRTMNAAMLLKPFPLAWEEQRQWFGFNNSESC